MNLVNRTTAKEKAKQFCKFLKKEQPDYNYLREIFRHIRKEMKIKIDSGVPKKLPYVPTVEEMDKYYKAVWKSKNMKYVVIIKTMLYTGVRVSELINIKLSDVDLDICQIRINKGKGNKDRIVPFPNSFMEVLAVHMDSTRKEKATYLFESSWKKPYSDRGIRKIMQKKKKALFLYRHTHRIYIYVKEEFLKRNGKKYRLEDFHLNVYPKKYLLYSIFNFSFQILSLIF